MQDFHELKVWRKAHALTLAVHWLTIGFPRAELYGLSAQLRRSSSSVLANIAEGCARNGRVEFVRFCSIAMGSASETEYHLLLAKDLNLIKPDDYTRMAGHATEVKKMLCALMLKLRADN
jgi:four helix bundle protein